MHIKRIVRCIYGELSLYMYYPLTVVTVLGIVIMCMLSEVVTLEDGSIVNVIRLFGMENKDEIMMLFGIRRFSIWGMGIGKWARTMLPLLLGLNIVFAETEKRNNRMDLFVLTRKGKKTYCLSYIVSSIIWSGSIMVIAYVAYGLCVTVFLPGGSEQADISQIMIELLNVFLYGLSINSLVVVCSLIVSDKYILMCLPLLIKYIYDQFVSRMVLEAVNDNDVSRITAWSNSYFESIRIGNDDIIIKLCVIILVYLFVFITMNKMIDRRGDMKGE